MRDSGPDAARCPVTIKGFEKVEVYLPLFFDKVLKKNGSIKSIELKK